MSTQTFKFEDRCKVSHHTILHTTRTQTSFGADSTSINRHLWSLHWTPQVFQFFIRRTPTQTRKTPPRKNQAKPPWLHPKTKHSTSGKPGTSKRKQTMPSPQTLLSPSELSYIHTSLSQTPPLRPDGRTTTKYRPLTAEQSLLPATNGSARVCWAEGEECLVGVRCDVEATIGSAQLASSTGAEDDDDDMMRQGGAGGEADWISLTIEIPGFRDDDSLPVFLGSLLSESLTQSGFLAKRLVINRLWHWRIYIDVSLNPPPPSTNQPHPNTILDPSPLPPPILPPPPPLYNNTPRPPRHSTPATHQRSR